jgi:hypothetical protein
MKSKEEELQREIERLRRENESLRGSSRQDKDPVRITAGKYKGFRTFRFEGNFRSFSIGARKVALILSAQKHLESYVAEERKKSDALSYEIAEGDISFNKSAKDGDDDIQI